MSLSTFGTFCTIFVFQKFILTFCRKFGHSDLNKTQSFIHIGTSKNSLRVCSYMAEMLQKFLHSKISLMGLFLQCYAPWPALTQKRVIKPDTW